MGRQADHLHELTPAKGRFVVYNEGRQLYWPKGEHQMLPHALADARVWTSQADAEALAASINARGPENGWHAYRVALERC